MQRTKVKPIDLVGITERTPQMVSWSVGLFTLARAHSCTRTSNARECAQASL